MKAFITSLLLFTLFACTPSSNQESQSSQSEEEWIQLFNGKDLTGWDIKIAGSELGENYKNNIKIEDGMFRVTYDEFENFDERYGHIYYKEPFSYYRLRYEYRFTGEQTPGGATWNVRNSGIMVHSQSAKSVGFDQHFPVSIEMQLLGGLNDGERPTGNLCTPGTFVEYNGQEDHNHCINSTSQTYHGDQWVKAEIIVLGGEKIIQLIEGDTVLTYEKPMIDSVFTGGNSTWADFNVPDGEQWKKRYGEVLTSGYIALQAESHPIDFRNIELQNLKGKDELWKPLLDK